jgi:hypothetical protein
VFVIGQRLRLEKTLKKSSCFNTKSTLLAALFRRSFQKEKF